jgi:hypothetical protein
VCSWLHRRPRKKIGAPWVHHAASAPHANACHCVGLPHILPLFGKFKKIYTYNKYTSVGSRRKEFVVRSMRTGISRAPFRFG